MAIAKAHINLPSLFELLGNNITDKWRDFKQRYEV